MIYDLIIPLHEKDLVKLFYCDESIEKNFSIKPQNKYIVSNVKINYKDYIWIPDEEAIPIKKSEINFNRQNWIYQQIIKLCQDFTINDTYMVVDSDVIFNRKIDIKKAFYISDRNQEHAPYFEFLKHYNISKQTNYTFINDFTIFEKQICREILGTAKEFFNKLNPLLSAACYPAEQETYGNYVVANYPNRYEIVFQKTQLNGKYYPDEWYDFEIETLIRNNKDKDIDLFTIHSWT